MEKMDSFALEFKAFELLRLATALPPHHALVFANVHFTETRIDALVALLLGRVSWTRVNRVKLNELNLYLENDAEAARWREKVSDQIHALQFYRCSFATGCWERLLAILNDTRCCLHTLGWASVISEDDDEQIILPWQLFEAQKETLLHALLDAEVDLRWLPEVIRRCGKLQTLTVLGCRRTSDSLFPLLAAALPLGPMLKTLMIRTSWSCLETVTSTQYAQDLVALLRGSSVVRIHGYFHHDDGADHTTVAIRKLPAVKSFLKAQRAQRSTTLQRCLRRQLTRSIVRPSDWRHVPMFLLE